LADERLTAFNKTVK